MNSSLYVGRFAPSPTGPLHFGSLVAALGSCLEARARGGRWLLRMEDVDEPRCSLEAADDLLRTLEAFGFAWDGPVLVQSRRKERYREVLDFLQHRGMVFPCACSRRELADSRLAADGAPIYPGTCRAGLPPGRAARSWRLRVEAGEPECFDDALQGCLCQDLASAVGDYVLLRADGYFAYQLAVVVDDADQGVTHVVRGADLLDSTPRQLYLQRCLGLPRPVYGHLPVAVNEQGEKLSKQTQAPGLARVGAPLELHRALEFLGQSPPEELRWGGVADVWQWARNHWSLDHVPRRRRLPAGADSCQSQPLYSRPAP